MVKEKKTTAEGIEVTLGGITYIVNELTGFQDQAIAQLLHKVDLSPLTVFLSEEGDPDSSTLIKVLIDVLADDRFISFLSVILVPKGTPVYRKDTASILRENVGDLTNAQIRAVVMDFFAKNLSSVTNFLPSMKKVGNLTGKSLAPRSDSNTLGQG